MRLLILKLTAMERKSKEKRAEIKSIDEAFEVLAKKRKSLKLYVIILCHFSC